MRYFILLSLIILLLVCVFIYFYNNAEHFNEFVSIDKTLDDEHTLIINNLNNLINLSNKHWNTVNKNNILNMQIDECYNMAKKHWETENKYFEIGKKNIPASHKNIENEINKHIAEHTDGLEKITKLKTLLLAPNASNKQFVNAVINIKTNIINHINTSDSKHFGHWVQNKSIKSQLT